MTPAFERLWDLVTNLKDATRRVENARNRPNDRVAGLNRIEPAVSYHARAITDGERRAFDRAKKIACDLERQEGEAERNATLREIASEIDAWRAVLPQLAAQVAIELGAVARSLGEEASS